MKEFWQKIGKKLGQKGADRVKEGAKDRIEGEEEEEWRLWLGWRRMTPKVVYHIRFNAVAMRIAFSFCVIHKSLITAIINVC